MNRVFFKQVKFHGDNFSYIVADEETKEAVVVDPSLNASEIIRILRDRNLNVKYIINTHDHMDHTEGNKEIKSACKARIVAHSLAHTEKDISIEDGQTFKLGRLTIKAIYTPGHSPDSICLLIDKKLLTGDTLFVGECGRTDLLGGSATDLYYSLFGKLMKLDENVEVYPGHDYGSKPHSTIGDEERTNYTLKKRTLNEFIDFMEEL